MPRLVRLCRYADFRVSQMPTQKIRSPGNAAPLSLTENPDSLATWAKLTAKRPSLYRPLRRNLFKSFRAPGRIWLKRVATGSCFRCGVGGVGGVGGGVGGGGVEKGGGVTNVPTLKPGDISAATA